MTETLVVKQIAGYITEQDMCRLFRKTKLTIRNWRRELGLPAWELPGSDRSAVRFKLEEVVAWAREHKKDVFLTKQQKAQLKGDPNDGGS